jgi:hypothetical protein
LFLQQRAALLKPGAHQTLQSALEIQDPDTIAHFRDTAALASLIKTKVRQGYLVEIKAFLESARKSAFRSTGTAETDRELEEIDAMLEEEGEEQDKGVGGSRLSEDEAIEEDVYELCSGVGLSFELENAITSSSSAVVPPPPTSSSSLASSSSALPSSSTVPSSSAVAAAAVPPLRLPTYIAPRPASTPLSLAAEAIKMSTIVSKVREYHPTGLLDLLFVPNPSAPPKPLSFPEIVPKLLDLAYVASPAAYYHPGELPTADATCPVIGCDKDLPPKDVHRATHMYGCISEHLTREYVDAFGTTSGDRCRWGEGCKIAGAETVMGSTASLAAHVYDHRKNAQRAFAKKNPKDDEDRARPMFCRIRTTGATTGPGTPMETSSDEEEEDNDKGDSELCDTV